MRCAACDAELSPADRCPACGADPRLAGRYRLESLLGRGGPGAVYRAIDEADGSVLAAKALPCPADLPADAQARLRRESTLLAQLQHPALPRWRGEVLAGQGRGRTLWLLRDFVEGQPLAEELAGHRYSEAEVLDVLIEALDALAWLHSRSPPVIHRDLKPANLVRRPGGSLALIDLGSARDAAPGTLGGSTVSGTFGYMAPEQFGGDALPASDVYGLGATAVALLSREDPAKLHDAAGRFAWQGRIAVSEPTRALLADMLEPDPSRRASDAAALAARARAIRAGEAQLPASAEEAAAVRPWDDPDRERRVLGASVLLGVALTLGALACTGLVKLLPALLWALSSP